MSVVQFLDELPPTATSTSRHQSTLAALNHLHDEARQLDKSRQLAAAVTAIFHGAEPSMPSTTMDVANDCTTTTVMAGAVRQSVSPCAVDTGSSAAPSMAASASDAVTHLHDMRECETCAQLLLCPICQEVTQRPVVSRCMHLFCYVCIETYLRQTARETLHREPRGPCPLCKQHVVITELVEVTTAMPTPKTPSGGQPTAGAVKPSWCHEEPCIARLSASLAKIPAIPRAALACLADPRTEVTETFPLQGMTRLPPRMDTVMRGGFPVQVRAPDSKEATRVFVDGKPLPPAAYAVVADHLVLADAALVRTQHRVTMDVVRATPLYNATGTMRLAGQFVALPEALVAHFDVASTSVGAKVTRVAHDICAMRSADATAKCVVYAQSAHTLQVSLAEIGAAIAFPRVDPTCTLTICDPYS